MEQNCGDVAYRSQSEVVRGGKAQVQLTHGHNQSQEGTVTSYGYFKYTNTLQAYTDDNQETIDRIKKRTNPKKRG